MRYLMDNISGVLIDKIVLFFFHKFYNHQKKYRNVSVLMGGKRFINTFLDTYDW